MSPILVSGFTFIHNGVEGGYPFVEAIDAIRYYVDEMVVVDMESTDETAKVLSNLGVRVLQGKWIPGIGGACLEQAHLLHKQCKGDVIWHFEADEVYSPGLAYHVWDEIHYIHKKHDDNILVYRLQVEQNFQRIRWYPELVHRVFPRGSVIKRGHTTDVHLANDWASHLTSISPSSGFLWDVTNCFKDDWLARVRNQANLWGGEERYLMVPLHCTRPLYLTREQAIEHLQADHWEWKHSPLYLPDNLLELVGVTSYKTHLESYGWV